MRNHHRIEQVVPLCGNDLRSRPCLGFLRIPLLLQKE